MRSALIWSLMGLVATPCFSTQDPFNINWTNLRERITEAGLTIEPQIYVSTNNLALRVNDVIVMVSVEGGQRDARTIEVLCNRHPDRRLTIEEVITFTRDDRLVLELDGSLTTKVSIDTLTIKSPTSLRIALRNVVTKILNNEKSRFAKAYWENGNWFRDREKPFPLEESRLIYDLSIEQLEKLGTKYWGVPTKKVSFYSGPGGGIFEANGIVVLVSLRSDFRGSSMRYLVARTPIRDAKKELIPQIGSFISSNWPRFSQVDLEQSDRISVISQLDLTGGQTLYNIRLFVERHVLEANELNEFLEGKKSSPNDQGAL